MKRRYKWLIGISSGLALISSSVVLSSCGSSNMNTSINEQSKYIADNQLQLHFRFTPNALNINAILTKLLCESKNTVAKKVYSDAVEQLMDPKSEINQPIDLYLNGWVFDYNYKTKEYYISTSSVAEKLKFSLSNSKNKNTPKYLFTFPVNGGTIINDFSNPDNNLKLFIKTNDSDNEILINSVSGINIDRLIDQFAYTTKNKEPLMQYKLLLHIPKDEYDNDVYGIYTDPTSVDIDAKYLYKKIVPNFEITKRENKAIGWSYLKFKLDLNTVVPNSLNLNSTYIDKNSTYLSKLIQADNLLNTKNFNKQNFLNVFPYSALQKNQNYTTAGYVHTKTNKKETNKFYQITTSATGLLKGPKKPFYVFNNGGDISVVPYDYMSGMSLDFYNQKINLAGSMIVNDNNQIVGINANSVNVDNNIYSIFIPFYTNVNYIYAGIQPFDILYKYTLENKANTLLNRIFTNPNFNKIK